MQKFADLTGTREARFALDLSHAGMVLHRRRESGGWERIAGAPLQLGSVAASFAALRAASGIPEGRTIAVELWLPEQHVLFRTIETGGPPPTEAVARHLFNRDGENDVVIDATARASGDLYILAGIPAEVLDETRDFLAPHGFEPVLYTLAAAPAGLDHAPVFAPRRSAASGGTAGWRRAGMAAACVAALLAGSGLYALIRPAEREAAREPLQEIRQIVLAPDAAAPLDTEPAQLALAAMLALPEGPAAPVPAVDPAVAPGETAPDAPLLVRLAALEPPFPADTALDLPLADQPRLAGLPSALAAPGAGEAGPAIFLAALQTGVAPLPAPGLPPAAPAPGLATNLAQVARAAVPGGLGQPSRASTDLTSVVLAAAGPASAPEGEDADGAVALAAEIAALDAADEAAQAERTELAAVEVFDTAPEIVPPSRPGAETVTVVPEAPDIVPPQRPGTATAQVPDEADPAESVAALTEDDAPAMRGVVVIPALPQVTPPPRPGSRTAAAPAAAPAEPEVIAALIDAAVAEDLAPSDNAIMTQAPPMRRPAAIVEAAQEQETILASLAPSDLALTRSDSPRRRPQGLAAPAAQAPQQSAPTPAPTPAAQAPAAAVASVAPPQVQQEPAAPPRNAAPQIPTSASVARAATVQGALPMRQLVLIGVYGRADSRQALMRTGSGRYIKVKPGDTIEGFQVSAISADAIRLRKSGRDTLLVIPE